jgi:[ribosomal protein S18]-alanine N-acetyltransferase
MSASPYNIRFMRKEDLSQVAQIDKEAFPTQWPPTNYRSELQNNLARYLVVYEKGVETETLKKPEENGPIITALKRLFGKDTVSRARETDIVVGFVGGWIMADELHITEIAVRGDRRGRGIGRLMLISIIEIGIQLKATLGTLEVRVSNTTAQKLYEQFGFAKVGVRKAYYTDNKEDAIIMTTPYFAEPAYRERFEALKRELIAKWQLPAIPQVERPAR